MDTRWRHMARLIIGHTTSSSVNIWIRGSERYPFGFVRIRGSKKNQIKKIELEKRHGYTGVIRFTGLTEYSEYDVKASFSNKPNTKETEHVEFGHCSGGFRTFRQKTANSKISFILGSCNLHTLGYVYNSDTAYERIFAEAKKADADFMMHCGDQIYFDVPPVSFPTENNYRSKYLDAWGDSRPARKLLTQLPQYMILDDHEIVDNFSNDKKILGTFPIDAYKNAGIKVYREFQYIHSPRNHGNDSLHYSFSCGKNEFFVMDTRSERYVDREIIISDDQMSTFKRWIKRNATKNKFVVTSVPFVSENKLSDDKWNGFEKQREEIIEYLFKNKISKVVFLCGDQHSSLYASMSITDGNREITINELMSSPINQIQKTKFSSYHSSHTRKTPSGISYTSSIRKSDFYNKHSNAMVVTVQGRNVKYKIFRTKKSETALEEKQFTL